jgi:hypothetical protein
MDILTVIFLFFYGLITLGTYVAFGTQGLLIGLLWCGFCVTVVTLDDYFLNRRKKAAEIRRQKADELAYRLKEKGLTLSDLFRKIEEDKWSQ